jgi:hypothetical protein
VTSRTSIKHSKQIFWRIFTSAAFKSALKRTRRKKVDIPVCLQMCASYLERPYWLECIELLNVTRIECIEQIDKPFVLRCIQRVEYWMHELSLKTIFGRVVVAL